jgi:hypothetical protein
MEEPGSRKGRNQSSPVDLDSLALWTPAVEHSAPISWQRLTCPPLAQSAMAREGVGPSSEVSGQGRFWAGNSAEAAVQGGKVCSVQLWSELLGHSISVLIPVLF